MLNKFISQKGIGTLIYHTVMIDEGIDQLRDKIDYLLMNISDKNQHSINELIVCIEKAKNDSNDKYKPYLQALIITLETIKNAK